MNAHTQTHIHERTHKRTHMNAPHTHERTHTNPHKCQKLDNSQQQLEGEELEGKITHITHRKDVSNPTLETTTGHVKSINDTTVHLKSFPHSPGPKLNTAAPRKQDLNPNETMATPQRPAGTHGQTTAAQSTAMAPKQPAAAVQTRESQRRGPKAKARREGDKAHKDAPKIRLRAYTCHFNPITKYLKTNFNIIHP